MGWNQSDDLPVWNVTWEDAEAFCQWLTAVEGRSYRLPTEAEWEFACRAGTHSRCYWGNQDIRRFARGSPSEDRPNAVGRLVSNGFGLHDLCGNVAEWCADWYDPDSDKNTPADDPLSSVARAVA